MQKLVSAGLFLFALSSQAAPVCNRIAGILPRPADAAGTADRANPIEHVLVIMRENHSFDNYFGSLSDPAFYGSQIDGIRAGLANPDKHGNSVPAFLQKDLCVEDPGHGWNDMHRDWNNGALDNFVRNNDSKDHGARVMGYYGAGDLPFYYSLANQFAVGDRYFASTMTQTFPNRFYLLAGTSFGQVRNVMPGNKKSYAQPTIFDLLDRYGITWKYYNDGSGYLKLFQPLYLRSLSKMKSISDYEDDLRAGTLPQVAFLDTSADGMDEHPDYDVQYGEGWAADRIRALMTSTAWKTSALFFTYDEGGGFYDHVAPPQACAPDSIAPLLDQGMEPGAFDRLGFRVPFVAVSPYAKHHFVSHNVYDHTSILKFIENKFNLPALTARDANADGFSDIFDFSNPVFEVRGLPSGIPDPTRSCNAPPEFRLPSQPVAITNQKNGLCFAIRGTAARFENCDGSAAEKFLLSQTHFQTSRIENVASSLCLQADLAAKEVSAVPCQAAEEDQGFASGVGNSDQTVELTPAYADACFTAGAVGEGMSLSTCNSADGNIDFYLR